MLKGVYPLYPSKNGVDTGVDTALAYERQAIEWWCIPCIHKIIYLMKYIFNIYRGSKIYVKRGIYKV